MPDTPESRSGASRDHSAVRWAVLKFGGTSVSTPERWETIAGVLREHIEEGVRPLVVCSALSQVSNQLEALLAEAAEGHDFGERLRALHETHHQLARAMDLDAGKLLGDDLAELDRLLTGISLTREVTPRLQARLMSTGEVLSTRLGAAWLSRQGLPTAWWDARDLLEAQEEPATSANALERQYLSATCPYDYDRALDARLQGVDAAVVLTQGFIARGPDGDTVLLGRGGSDTSAAYLAARFGAERLEIWTDVPGLFTSNPARIRGCRLLRRLGYAEAGELASRGAKVLHPRCLAPVRERGIPLHLRCTPQPDLEGTVISDDAAQNRPGIKGVLARPMMTVEMHVEESWQRVGLIAEIGAVFRQHGLSIDMFASSMTHVTVALDPTANPLDDAVVEALLRDLEAIAEPKVVRPTVAVSVVGTSIGDLLHELGPFLQHFEHENVHLVSHSANDLSLTVVVDENASDRLVQRLHDRLFEAVPADDPSFGPTWEELRAGPSSAGERSPTAPAGDEEKRGR